MAHWAKIDENGIVENVIVTSNQDEDEGESWINEHLDGTWVKTSYNTRKNKHILGGIPFRKNYAEIGGTYNLHLDCFIPAKKDNESNFILDEYTCTWIPPVPFPEDADFVITYGKEPEVIESEIEINGEIVKSNSLNIPPGSKVYYWSSNLNAWALQPTTKKPDGHFNWDPIIGEWVELEHSSIYPSSEQEWPSWVQREDGLWVAPVAMPLEGAHVWDEEAGDWHRTA
jgi:hypothetical protein